MSNHILVPANTHYFTGNQKGQQIYGKPLITTNMKRECMGEFWFEEEVWDEETETMKIKKTTIDWTTCKEIYTRMVQAAAKEVKTDE